MYVCAICGALIDAGYCETDCPRGCYDKDDVDPDPFEIKSQIWS